MSSIFLKKLTEIFGKNFEKGWFVEEALWNKDERNRSLAMIGDNLLNACAIQLFDLIICHPSLNPLKRTGDLAPK